MTDRTRKVTVILDADYRVDDAESIVQAIGMVKGVAHVEVGPNDYFARQAVGREIGQELGRAVSYILQGRPFKVTEVES